MIKIFPFLTKKKRQNSIQSHVPPFPQLLLSFYYISVNYSSQFLLTIFALAHFLLFLYNFGHTSPRFLYTIDLPQFYGNLNCIKC